MKRLALTLLVAFPALVVIGACEEARLLALGWIDFLRETPPRARVNPAGVFSGLVFVLLFVALTDLFARWCCRGASRRWRFRWTLSILLGLALMFATGYSAIGLARQIGWLMTSKEPLYGERLAFDWSNRLSGNLRWVAMGLHSYHDRFHTFPCGGTFSRDGQPMGAARPGGAPRNPSFPAIPS